MINMTCVVTDQLRYPRSTYKYGTNITFPLNNGVEMQVTDRGV